MSFAFSPTHARIYTSSLIELKAVFPMSRRFSIGFHCHRKINELPGNQFSALDCANIQIAVKNYTENIKMEWLHSSVHRFEAY